MIEAPLENSKQVSLEVCLSLLNKPELFAVHLRCENGDFILKFDPDDKKQPISTFLGKTNEYKSLENEGTIKSLVSITRLSISNPDELEFVEGSARNSDWVF